MTSVLSSLSLAHFRSQALICIWAPELTNPLPLTSFFNFFFWLMEIFFWARETFICCSNYLCIPWLLLVYALTGDWTLNLGILRQHSNQLSYMDRGSLNFLPTSPDPSYPLSEKDYKPAPMTYLLVHLLLLPGLSHWPYSSKCQDWTTSKQVHIVLMTIESRALCQRACLDHYCSPPRSNH